MVKTEIKFEMDFPDKKTEGEFRTSLFAWLKEWEKLETINQRVRSLSMPAGGEEIWHGADGSYLDLVSNDVEHALADQL
jgi:hypothetical protein